MANTTGPDSSAGTSEDYDSVWAQLGAVFRLGPEQTESGAIPEWLRVVKAFGRRPFAFILGVVLQTFLIGLETMTTAILDAIRYLFVGESVTTTSGQLGIADVPMLFAELLIGVGQPLGELILSVASLPAMVTVDLASGAGIFALPILAAGTGFYLIALAVLLNALIDGLADLDPTGILTAIKSLLGGVVP